MTRPDSSSSSDRAKPAYYADRLSSLADVFGTPDVSLDEGALLVAGRRYPIVDDVIVLLDPSQYPESLRHRLGEIGTAKPVDQYAPDIQDHYSKFWREWDGLLPYHEREFAEYFDLVDLESLANLRVADFGAGMGRWSYLLAQRCACRELVLIDFSEAIFTARDLLKGDDRALFFMGDITRLPFREGFADFIMSLGVLHHLPIDCLDMVRRLKRYAPRALVYLYYALDNKPFYYRWLLRMYTPLRRLLWRVKSERFRVAFSWFGLFAFYMPFIAIGFALRPFGLARWVPLFDEHHWAGLEGMRHSVYDRFFTRIEQRVTREQIAALGDTYRVVRLADGQAYYHFLCET